MNQLEQLTGETCVSQFSASLAVCPDEQEEHCLHCLPSDYQYCDRYKPLNHTSKRYAYVRLYKK
jgi:hypothetical protein